jgi:hypothetical protein
MYTEQKYKGNLQYENHSIDICGILLCDKTAYFSGFLLSPAQGAPV